jgi:hypothetical protein
MCKIPTLMSGWHALVNVFTSKNKISVAELRADLCN